VYANDKNKTKQYEYLKKAKYFEIRAELEAGEITLEEAQKMWQKELNKLKKREGK
jgi:exonuclease VII small subunit